MEKINLQNDRISDRLAKLKNESSKQRYLQNFPFTRIGPEDKKIHRYITRIMNKSKIFMLKIEPSVNQYNQVTAKYGYIEPRALFSRKLVDLCGKFFREFILEFQVKERPSVNAVAELIDNYNKVNYKKLPKNEMLKFFLLLQDKSFDAIKKSGIYSKSSFYRYVQRFKQIGITQASVVPTSMVQVNTDFRDYHSHLMYGSRMVNRGR